MSDTKKFRQAFVAAGFRQRNPWLPQVFNDKRKKSGIRRIKLWQGSHIFDAPVFAQEALDRQFKAQFGTRYLFGEFVRASERVGGKSLVIYLLD